MLFYKLSWILMTNIVVFDQCYLKCILMTMYDNIIDDISGLLEIIS